MCIKPSKRLAPNKLLRHNNSPLEYIRTRRKFTFSLVGLVGGSHNMKLNSIF